MGKYYKQITYVNFYGGGVLKNISNNNQKLPHSYKKLFNKKDPIDKQILKLVKEGELKVGFVWFKEAPEPHMNIDHIPSIDK